MEVGFLNQTCLRSIPRSGVFFAYILDCLLHARWSFFCTGFGWDAFSRQNCRITFTTLVGQSTRKCIYCAPCTFWWKMWSYVAWTSVNSVCKIHPHPLGQYNKWRVCVTHADPSRFVYYRNIVGCQSAPNHAPSLSSRNLRSLDDHRNQSDLFAFVLNHPVFAFPDLSFLPRPIGSGDGRRRLHLSQVKEFLRVLYLGCQLG